MQGTGEPKTPPRRVEYMRLDEIQHAPRNPKGHDGPGINRAIQHFGLGELPLLDERTGLLVAGHGRLEQLEKMLQASAVAPPDGVSVDGDGMWLVPVVRGWASRSDGDAEAYLVASNHLTTRGGWDDAGLADMLSGLAELDPALLEVTGFSEGDLAAILGEQSEYGDDETRTGGDDGPAPDSADELNRDPGGYREQYGVIVMCRDERHQEDVYGELIAEGHKCRVVTT